MQLIVPQNKIFQNYLSTYELPSNIRTGYNDTRVVEKNDRLRSFPPNDSRLIWSR